MNALVFEHVPVAELPQKWRERLSAVGSATVTVRIEEEAIEQSTDSVEAYATDDPAFGIWRDREDMTDVAAYVRKVRQARYNRDGSRNEP